MSTIVALAILANKLSEETNSVEELIGLFRLCTVKCVFSNLFL